MKNTARFRTFVQSFTGLVSDYKTDEERIFTEGQQLLSDLIKRDDWLPDQFAKPHPDRYQQYLLHCDPLERFSVASFIWGPGHTTPVHDHTVWGMVGVMRGEELCDEFDVESDTGKLVCTCSHNAGVGEIDLVSPTVGDVHKVSNALDDEVSVSIHVYGANIGAVRRHVFDPATGKPSEFVSGYASDVMPNLWDQSA
jgi:predicted metal-dependent enzyme (double-stranded beta helix superfamily)